MSVFLLSVLLCAPQEADKPVRDAIVALEKALAAPDESLADQFDLSRLVREMERRGSIPDEGGGRFRYRNTRRLEDHLGGLAASPGTLRGGWQKIQPLTVRLNPAGEEADALCRVTIGGKPCKFRLWLVRDGASWKTYDMENLDGSFRLSVIGLQYTPGVHDDEDRNALRDGVMTLQRATVHLAKGQPEAARDALAMARRAGAPDYVGSWIDLVDGQALSALGDHDAALKAAGRVLAKQKDLAVAHRLQATSLVALGEPAKAVAAGKEYLKLVGDDAEMWTLVARAHAELGQATESIDAYRKAVASDPEDVASRVELGRALLARREAKDALPLLSAAVRLSRADDKVYHEAADLLEEAGAHAEALELAGDAARLRPDEADVLLRRGRALRRLERLKEAEETLRRASKLHLDEIDLRQELALTLAQAGKDAEAQEQLKTADKVSEWYVAYLRAFIHAAAGRTGAATGELKSVFSQGWNVKFPIAWIERERVFEKVREDKAAVALLADARAVRDYWAARENPRLPAEEMLRIATARIEAAPGHDIAYLDQAHALRRLKRPEEAEAALLKGIEKIGRRELYLDELGRTLAVQGKLDEALQVADELMRDKSKAAQFGLDLRVSVYALAGRREQAIKALQELLDKHPDWYPAVTTGSDLDAFRKLPTVQALIRKAREKVQK